MKADTDAQLIRRAIGGDEGAVAQVSARVESSDTPMLLVLAAMLADVRDGAALLDRAAAVAVTREHRQTVAVARAHLEGDETLVDALARDHLVDFPGSYLVAWVASGAGIIPQ